MLKIRYKNINWAFDVVWDKFSSSKRLVPNKIWRKNLIPVILIFAWQWAYRMKNPTCIVIVPDAKKKPRNRVIFMGLSTRPFEKMMGPAMAVAGFL